MSLLISFFTAFTSVLRHYLLLPERCLALARVTREEVTCCAGIFPVEIFPRAGIPEGNLGYAAPAAAIFFGVFDSRPGRFLVPIIYPIIV